MPFDGIAFIFQSLSAVAGQGRGYDAVLSALHHQDGQMAVGGMDLSSQAVRQWEIGGQGGDAAQRLWVTQAGMQGYGAALGKTCQDDSVRRDAARQFTIDQCRDQSLRLMDAMLIFPGSEFSTENVIPGAHHHATIERDRPFRSMGENKAHRPVRRQLQMRDQGNEITAIGTQAMQPDDAGGGRCLWFDFNSRYGF